MIIVIIFLYYYAYLKYFYEILKILPSTIFIWIWIGYNEQYMFWVQPRRVYSYYASQITYIYIDRILIQLNINSEKIVLF